jgi:hypothetical protein
MKYYILLSVFTISFLLTFPGKAQRRAEFPVYSNGFIYSDSAMGRLKLVVDSLNLKFRYCDPYKTYFAIQQSPGHYVHLNGKKARKAKEKVLNQVSYSDFKIEFPEASYDENLLLLRYENTNLEDEKSVSIYSVDPEDYGHEITEPLSSMSNTGNSGSWLYRVDGSDFYAFYLLQDFTSSPIPAAYARLIQYSDCMVDTSQEIFSPKASDAYRGFIRELKASKKLSDFIAKLTNKPERKSYPKKDDDKYYDDYRTWDTAKYIILDKEWSVNLELQKLLSKAVKEALDSNASTWELEDYAERYLSKSTALALKRNRRVIGGCSMDQSPRIHAREIASLSAEAFNWEIFLRAHLDIMNDRFSRVSDGSYAWAGRATYIAELEALNIDVTDLLLGIVLRISNPSGHHYFGDVGRLGRAFVESRDASQLEIKLLKMVEDQELDLFNRVVAFNLFRSYYYHLNDKRKTSHVYAALQECKKSLPDFLAGKIELKEKSD